MFFKKKTEEIHNKLLKPKKKKLFWHKF